MLPHDAINVVGTEPRAHFADAVATIATGSPAPRSDKLFSRSPKPPIDQLPLELPPADPACEIHEII